VTALPDSAATSTDKAASSEWPVTDATATYGSSSDTWGNTWMPEQINHSSFGILISATRAGDANSNRSARIDRIQITVTYEIPAEEEENEGEDEDEDEQSPEPDSQPTQIRRSRSGRSSQGSQGVAPGTGQILGAFTETETQAQIVEIKIQIAWIIEQLIKYLQAQILLL
jgi:hypothetical protein